MSDIVSLYLDSVVRSIVDAALPAWHPTRAVYLGFDLRVSDDNHEPLTSGSVNILVHKPSNYLTVWGYADRNILPRWSRINLKEWGEHIISHDSGWRDAIRRQVIHHYFLLCEEANVLLKKEDKDTKSPKDLNTFNSIHSVALLDIEYERRPSEKDRYDKGQFLTGMVPYRPENQMR